MWMLQCNNMYLDKLQISDSWRSVMDHLRKNFDINLNHFGLDMEDAVAVRTVFNPIFLVKTLFCYYWQLLLYQMFFNSILLFWEPQFHPLIREVSFQDLEFLFSFCILSFCWFLLCNLCNVCNIQDQKETLMRIARQLVLAENNKCYRVCFFLPFSFSWWINLVLVKKWIYFCSHLTWIHKISWIICSLMCVLTSIERRKKPGYALLTVI